MSQELRVKGTSIRSKLEFVRHRFGDDAVEPLQRLLQQHGAAPLLDATWYPYLLYDSVLQEIATRHYGGEVVRLAEVGRFSAEAALTTTYSAYARRHDFRGFLARLPTLHSAFYSLGKLTVQVGEDGRSALLKVVGATMSAGDLQVARGFYLGAARLMALRDVRCEARIADDEASFALSWVPAEEG